MTTTTRSRRLVLTALSALLVLAVGAWWWASPWWVLRDLQAAAREHDAARFNAHVDYPQLRDSVKDQVGAMMDERLGQSGVGDGPAALGALLGRGVVNAMVDVMVRPETVMRAMDSGLLRPGAGPRPPVAPDTGAGTGPGASGPAGAAAMEWVTERQGANRLLAWGRKPGAPDGDRLGLVFERRGFADWVLTGVRLPGGKR